MYEMGDVIILPSRFGDNKKGVLVRKEADGYWLIQIGTSDFKYLPEEELRSIARTTKCWKCGALLNSSADTKSETLDGPYQCPFCGTWERRESANK